MNVELFDIPTGNAGLQIKLERLRSMVDAATSDPAWRDFVLGQVRNVREKDYDGEARAVSRFVRKMRYTRDPAGVELFTEPREMARRIVAGNGFGDCDDAALLGAAMLETLGHPCRFVVGGHRGAQLGSPAWAHIWTEWRHPSRGWTALDDTAKQYAPGWRPDGHFDTVLREVPDMRYQLPSVVDADSWPVELGGLSDLGKLRKKLGKTVKKVGKVTGATAVTKGVTKVAKKALPVAAMVAPVIPGVGVAASAALAVAAQQVKRREMVKKARRAEAAAAAWAAAAEAQPDPSVTNPPVVEYAAAPAPSWQTYDDPRALPFTAEDMRYAAAEEAYQQPPAFSYPEYAQQVTDAAEPEYAGEVYGLGWWDSLVSTVTGAAQSVMPYAQAALPTIQKAAQSGAFGRRGIKVAARADRILARPGVQAAMQAGRSVATTYAQRSQVRQPPQAPQRSASAGGGGGGGAIALAVLGLVLFSKGRK